MTVTTLDVASAHAVPALRERHPLLVQLGRYAVAGGVGTLVNAVVFLSLRTWWDLLPANLAALVLSTLVSTEVNRRFTFSGEHGHRWRAHVQTAATVAFYAVYSSAILLALHAVVENPTPLMESVTVAVGSVLGGAARFLLLRFWVFDRDRPEPTWHGVRMRHSTATRTIAAVAAGAALLLSSAGACGPTGVEDGGVPGVSDQQGDDDGDDRDDRDDRDDDQGDQGGDDQGQGDDDGEDG